MYDKVEEGGKPQVVKLAADPEYGWLLDSHVKPRQGALRYLRKQQITLHIVEEGNAPLHLMSLCHCGPACLPHAYQRNISHGLLSPSVSCCHSVEHYVSHCQYAHHYTRHTGQALCSHSLFVCSVD